LFNSHAVTIIIPRRRKTLVESAYHLAKTPDAIDARRRRRLTPNKVVARIPGFSERGRHDVAGNGGKLREVEHFIIYLGYSRSLTNPNKNIDHHAVESLWFVHLLFHGPYILLAISKKKTHSKGGPANKTRKTYANIVFTKINVRFPALRITDFLYSTLVFVSVKHNLSAISADSSKPRLVDEGMETCDPRRTGIRHMRHQQCQKVVNARERPARSQPFGILRSPMENKRLYPSIDPYQTISPAHIIALARSSYFTLIVYHFLGQI